MPSPLDALQYIIGNPGEAAGMAKDMMMRNYYPMPEQDFGQAGQMPFPNPFFPGATVQGAYDTTRDMTALHPGMELAGAAAGAPVVGRMAGKVLGPAVRGLGQFSDNVGQYMGKMQGPHGGGAAAFGPDVPLPNPGPAPPANPLAGFGQSPNQQIMGDLPQPAPPSPQDVMFQGMDPADMERFTNAPPAPNPYMPQGGIDTTPQYFLDSQAGGNIGAPDVFQPNMMGPDDFPNPDQYARHLDQTSIPAAQGPPPEVVDQMIMEAAQGFMAQGATPEMALEAAMMQFSDLVY